MHRIALCYIIDTLLALLFLAIAFIGILLGFFVTQGPRAGWSTLWGLNHQAWSSLHLYLALAFVALILVHFVLHWDWVVRTTRRYLPRSVVAWIILMIVGAAIIVYAGAALMTSAQGRRYHGFRPVTESIGNRGLHRRWRGGHEASRDATAPAYARFCAPSPTAPSPLTRHARQELRLPCGNSPSTLALRTMRWTSCGSRSSSGLARSRPDSSAR
jgi:hypothetical protein